MPRPAVATDFLQALDVHLHLMAKLTLDTVLLLDRLAELVRVLGGKILRPRIGAHVETRQDLPARRKTDAVDIGKRYLYAFLIWKVDTGDSYHSELAS